MPQKSDSTRLADRLGDAAAAVAERLERQEALVRRLSAPLERLAQGGAQTTSELAQAQGVRHQSMAATVIDLEVRGYVDRRAHPTDVRKVLIELTEEGGEALAEERRRRLGWLAAAISDRLEPEERQTLVEALPLLERLLADTAG